MLWILNSELSSSYTVQFAQRFGSFIFLVTGNLVYKHQFMCWDRGVSNAAKLHTRLHNLYNFTKITPGSHWDYNKFASGLHIFVIQELAVIS